MSSAGRGAIVKGSIEYAVAELGVTLIMVLGHSKCGSRQGCSQTHRRQKDELPGNIDDLVNLIKPSVARTKGDKGDALENAIKANVRNGVKRLQELHPILAGPVKEGKVKVVGGVYDLRTGGVEMIN